MLLLVLYRPRTEMHISVSYVIVVVPIYHKTCEPAQENVSRFPYL